MWSIQGPKESYQLVRTEDDRESIDLEELKAHHIQPNKSQVRALRYRGPVVVIVVLTVLLVAGAGAVYLTVFRLSVILPPDVKVSAEAPAAVSSPTRPDAVTSSKIITESRCRKRREWRTLLQK